MLITPAVRKIIDGFITQAKNIATSGLSLGSLADEFGRLQAALVATLVAELDGDPNTRGIDKKALVLEAVGMLFDALAVSIIAIPWWLKPFWPLLVSSFRDYTLKQAGGLIEWVLTKYRIEELSVKGA